jgi:hypothetical protein
MDPTALVVIPILGLKLNLGTCISGTICFTNTRGANPAFYQWLVETLAVEFVKTVKALEEEDHRVFYSMDGEGIQLNGFTRCHQILDDLSVDVIKHRCSCSTITNALDRGSMRT